MYRICKNFYSYRRKNPRLSFHLDVSWFCYHLCNLDLITSSVLQAHLICVPFWKPLHHLLCIFTYFGKMLEKGLYPKVCHTGFS